MEENDDGLSALPDGVLIHILSLLDSRFAVQTCILSSRWRYLWSYTTRIYLRIDKNLTKALASKYDKFFLGHQAGMLECLNVGFRINNRTKKHVIRWLCHLLASKKVQKIMLDLWRAGLSRDGRNEIPFHLFNCQSIVALDLSNCCLESTSCCSNFSSLRTLYAWRTSSETVSSFLSTCSLIESCIISDSSITSISAPWLKSLTIKTYNSERVVKNLEISAPNLHHLELRGVCANLSLRNVKSLDTLLLCSCSRSWLSLIQELAYVKKLKLDFLDIDRSELQILRKQTVPFRFHQLEDLKLDINLKDKLPLMDFLLHSSPNLRFLDLHIYGECDDKKNFWDGEDILCGALPNLRRVNIKNFGGNKSSFQLIQFLLQKACVLEFLKVECNEKSAKKELVIVKKLRSMPRISPRVKIEIFRKQLWYLAPFSVTLEEEPVPKRRKKDCASLRRELVDNMRRIKELKAEVVADTKS